MLAAVARQPGLEFGFGHRGRELPVRGQVFINAEVFQRGCVVGPRGRRRALVLLHIAEHLPGTALGAKLDLGGPDLHVVVPRLVRLGQRPPRRLVASQASALVENRGRSEIHHLAQHVAGHAASPCPRQGASPFRGAH